MSDLIKREDAIKAVIGWETDPLDEELERAINDIPSADRPQGEWEIYVISPFDGEDCRCSECGQTGCVPYWDYCPNCGARMDTADTPQDGTATANHFYGREGASK